MNSIPSDKFTEWAAGLQNADEEAFSELFRQTYNPLLGYANNIVACRETAKDILQEVYIKIWKIRIEIDEDKSLKALMFQIARNLCLNYLRDHPEKISAGELELMDKSAQVNLTPNDSSNEEYLNKIQGWIKELPKKQGEVFELSRLEGLDHEEIAQVMKCSKATVNNHIVNALKNLREKVKKHKITYRK